MQRAGPAQNNNQRRGRGVQPPCDLGPACRALLLCDDQRERQHICHILEGQGINVTMGPPELGSLSLTGRRGAFELLILEDKPDLAAPFSAALRERYPRHELPLLLLSDRNDDRTMAELVELGVNDFLIRPTSPAQILARTRSHLEMARMNRAYRRFVPAEFLSLLGKESIEDVRQGDQVQRQMAVLFADIRGFTALSESMTPAENFNFINSFLGRMGPIIRQSGGFIDKYLGDGLMAIFPGMPGDAAHAAVGMNRELYRYNRHRARCAYPPLKIGIGIHHGTLMLGTVGEQERMDGTVISSDVNLASRLERLTKRFGVSVIASDDILLGMDPSERPDSRRLGRVLLKGRGREVEVHHVFQGESLKLRAHLRLTRDIFEEGLEQFLAGRLEPAARAFRMVTEMSPEDTAARFYLSRCRFVAARGLPGDWNGTLDLDHEEATEDHLLVESHQPVAAPITPPSLQARLGSSQPLADRWFER